MFFDSPSISIADNREQLMKLMQHQCQREDTAYVSSDDGSVAGFSFCLQTIAKCFLCQNSQTLLNAGNLIFLTLTGELLPCPFLPQ